MYRLLIIDADPKTKKELDSILCENYPKEYETWEAQSLGQAYELKEAPDILFVDMLTCGSDAEGVLAKLRSLYPKIGIIVISALEVFSHAKAALEIGAGGYLKKPLIPQEVALALGRVLKVSKGEVLSDAFAGSESIGESFIYDALYSGAWEKRLTGYREKLAITKDCFFALAVAPAKAPDSMLSFSEAEDDIRKLFISHIKGIISAPLSECIIIAVCCDKPSDEYAHRLKTLSSLNLLIKNVSATNKLSLRVGVGELTSIYRLNSTLRQALFALNQTRSGAVHYSDLSPDVPESKTLSDEAEMIIRDIKNKDTLSLSLNAQKYFSVLSERYASFNLLKLEVIYEIMRFERAMPISLSIGNGCVKGDYLSETQVFASVQELSEWFSQKISGLCELIKSHSTAKNTGVVESAKQYLLSHYADEISLDDVARAVFVSPNYFSRLFKEETGRNYIDFLTEIRLNKAKELLRRGEMNLKEISAEVGYGDANYFGRLFKKAEGITPMEYRAVNAGK